jgi:hypothetical protein
MDFEVQKTKPLPAAKALEKIEKFIQKHASSQADALAAEQAAQEALARGEEPDETSALKGGTFAQHRLNHISPDVFSMLQLMRDAMRAEQQKAAH